MAFDGVVIAALVEELKDRLIGARVTKIIQPEKDELILTLKNYDQFRLLISADAGLPLIYLTDIAKEAPLQSPAFCMLLRKHIGTARITDIYQPDFERIINIEFEHYDEMGDLRHKVLIFELMGKHSNIIFCDDKGNIIDSIKRVPSSLSSVREVLPGREYFITKTVEKYNPLTVTEKEFTGMLTSSPCDIAKAVYGGITGISPLTANEIVFRSGIDPDIGANSLDADMAIHLYRVFGRFVDSIRESAFEPAIILKNGVPEEFSAIRLTSFEGKEEYSSKSFESISTMLGEYYSSRSTITRIRQRSSDLNRIVSNALAREVKKYELQLKQLEDTGKRDKYRLYGELLTTYGYSAQPEAKSITVNNYYTGEDITIPLDPDKSAIDNAKAYFDRYSKLKRTYEALSGFIVGTKADIEHLESIRIALDIARHEEDLSAIREELIEFGYMKDHSGKNSSSKGRGMRSGAGKKTGRRISEPFHYVTAEGYHIYVGKNNYQNDELTFRFASGNDWWFHAKGAAGSHVILKNPNEGEIPDRVFEQAAAAAAYYSKNRDNDKAEVDYLLKKNVKKPNSAKPGFVVYYTNYSMVAVPGIDGLTECD